MDEKDKVQKPEEKKEPKPAMGRIIEPGSPEDIAMSRRFAELFPPLPKDYLKRPEVWAMVEAIDTMEIAANVPGAVHCVEEVFRKMRERSDEHKKSDEASAAVGRKK